jgi:hypothetical protein
VPQVNPHDVPSQVAVAFEGGVQAVHDVAPQLEVLPFETHAVPHRWKPDLQVKPHCVPLQVAVAFAGAAQAVHDVVPQLPTPVFGWQVPEQSCEPLGQTPPHEALLAMQAPAQSFIPDGHVPPQDVPSQVAVPPPVGTGHAVHEAPHPDTLVLATHAVPQA